MDLSKYKVNIPEGQSGDWEVSKFEITESDAKMWNLRQAINLHRPQRMIKSGFYTMITRNGKTIMSDTPSEIEDHLEAINKAKGKVLINGLGIGMVLKACLENPKVEHVTVVEISKDVIKLVGGEYKRQFGDKLTIINESAFDYIPPEGVMYDIVWHDIWDDICEDNLDDMGLLDDKYCNICEWQGFWAEEQCQ